MQTKCFMARTYMYTYTVGHSMHRTSYITSKTGRKTHDAHFTSLYDGYKLVHK